MSEQTTSTSGSYQIELLGPNNWVPWKRRISAILRDLGLEEYIEKDLKCPIARDPANQMKKKRSCRSSGTLVMQKHKPELS